MRKLSKNTLFFGLTSFLVDISTEMINSIMPFFLINVLGATSFLLGVIEGIGEFVVAFFRVISGYLSDKLGKRKVISEMGYGLSAFSKLFLFFANSYYHVLLIKIVERIGKGIRGVPRDVMIAFSEKKENLGFAFGFRKMMDSMGAILGPLIAAVLLTYLSPFFSEEGVYRVIFLIAVIPATLGAFIIFWFSYDIPFKKESISKNHLMENSAYKKFFLTASLFSLAQFSTSFFILRAAELSSEFYAMLGYALYNILYTFSAIPVGRLTDKFGGKIMLIVGYLLFALVVFGFSIINSPLALFLFAPLGIFMAIIETTPRAFISTIIEKSKLGIAIGSYQGFTGMLLLPANLLAGFFWNYYFLGIRFSFLFSFIIALSSVVYFLISSKK